MFSFIKGEGDQQAYLPTCHTILRRITMKPYLLEAAFGLQGRSQLLLLLHSHLNNLVQKLLLRLLGVESAVQCLPQALQLWLQSWFWRGHWGCDGCCCRGRALCRRDSADGPLSAWWAQVLGWAAGRSEGRWRQGGQGRSDCWERHKRKAEMFCWGKLTDRFPVDKTLILSNQVQI